MKGNIQFLAIPLLLFLSSSAKADVPVFGNSPDGGPGFSISTLGQLSSSGGAVEFTPSEDIYVDSVTLWLSDYTGQHNQTIFAGIYNNNDNPVFNLGTANDYPWQQILSFSPAAPNDGSLASFNFSNPTGTPIYNPTGSTLLSANTPYWLVVTAEGQPGNNMPVVANWVGGGTPTGEASYDGSDYYNVYGGSYDSSSALPAFTIDIVPEPDFTALMGIPLLIGIAWRFYRNRNSGN